MIKVPLLSITGKYFPFCKMVVIATMKRFHVEALLTAMLAVVAYQGSQATIYAASDSGAQSMGSSPHTGSSSDEQVASKDGAQSYADHCAICHGNRREGILPAFPPLQGVGRHMADQQITDLIHNGKGRMPGFPKLQQAELIALLHYLASGDLISSTAATSSSATDTTRASGLTAAGGALFQQNCAFCHGRDAGGGETGPDLTRSKLVIADDDGDRIADVIRTGRPEKKMPGFNFSSQEMLSVVAFVRAQEEKAAAQKGSRRGVDVSDLQTGNVDAGKQYFNGTGGCVTCHSTTGDLAGVATRYQGLQLEERMLYPRDAKSRVTVMLPSGQKVTGTLAYLDEFTVGLRDINGSYRSWPINTVKYFVDSPVNAHVELFGKYTDGDIHNLMAYLQTLR
jgi:mono/diheme cytochrome c family protein